VSSLPFALSSNEASLVLTDLPTLRVGGQPTDTDSSDADEVGNEPVIGQRLIGRTEAEQHEMVLTLVIATAAAVLGHASTDGIGPRDDFLDLGFSSMTAVERRNQLSAATGLDLPPALIYHASTPAARTAYPTAHLLQLPPSAPPPP